MTASRLSTCHAGTVKVLTTTAKKATRGRRYQVPERLPAKNDTTMPCSPVPVKLLAPASDAPWASKLWS
jgi:hypothetical protein